MDILDSILGEDIKKVMNNNSYKTQHWLMEIHTPDETIEVFKVLNIDIGRDYVDNFGDELVVSAMIPGGDYSYKMYPNLDQLEATLYRFDIGQNNVERLLPSMANWSQRYVANVIKPPASVVEQNTRNQATERNLNLTQMLDLNIQLIPATIDQLRMMTVGGVYRNTNSIDLVKSILTYHSLNIDVSSEMMPLGVDIIEEKDIATREHYVIPHGTRVVDAPGYIHKNCGGVYNTGFSYYFQDKMWYVYPTYNTERYNLTQKTITIINIPTNRMPGSERTFLIDGNHTTILATGNTQFTDVSEPQLLNMGNGVRYADAANFMGSFVETVNNKTVASRGKNNNEYITVERSNDLNNASISNTRISSNPKYELSQLSGRDGVVISLVWENSDISTIYPGVPIKFKFLKEEKLKEVDGVVLKAHHYIQMSGKGVLANKHICTTTLALFVKRSVFKNL